MVIATNMTVKSPVGYANRTQPRSHVAMAFRLEDPAAIDGMFISIDKPTHSIRTGRDQDGPLLITLGPRFNTGQDGDVARRFRTWSNGLGRTIPSARRSGAGATRTMTRRIACPMSGSPTRKRRLGFHVATGFNGWGISNGTAAGLQMASEICHRLTSLGQPLRPDPACA